MTRATAAMRHRPKPTWWPLAKRVLIGAFFALVAWLLYEQAREIDWDEVTGVLRKYPWHTLAIAAALGACSHAVYSTFDLLGRHWTGHRLPAREVVPLTFVCYAFNLNLGSLVGGFALRYRLYSRLGLDNETITRVLASSLVTNWLGYLVLAGGLFAMRVITPPDDWKIGATALQLLGFVLLAAASAYVAASAFAKKRQWSVRGHAFELPPLRLAALQLGLSMTNWSLMAAMLWVLLGQKLPYPLVLGVLLLAAVAGVIAHIPAGLGVLEAVFVALLGHLVPRGTLLAALIAYRALYYLAPLVLAVAIYLVLEARAKRSTPHGASAVSRPSA